MADEYDPFKTDSPFKDDYDGEIVEAWFGIAENYGDNLLAFLKVVADDGEEVENRYGMGGGWNSFDQGETVEHEKATPDNPKHFINTTAYAQLMAAAMESGAEDELRRRSRDELNNMGPRAAALWKGLKFHWEVKTETGTRKDRTTGEQVPWTSNRVLPTKFLGVAGSATASPVSQTAQAAPQPASTGAEGTTATSGTDASPPPAQPGTTQPTEAAASNGGGGVWDTIPPALQVPIKAMATSQDYSSWVDSVMALPGVLDNAMLVSALGDEALYNSLRA